MSRLIIFSTCLLFIACTQVMAQQDPKAAPATKKQLRAEDYGVWESLRGAGTLSPDGKWMAYSVSRVNGKNELRLRKTSGEGEKETFMYGSRPSFSGDSRWLAWLEGQSEEEREKLKKSKKPARNKLQLRRLGDQDNVEIEGVSSFDFSEQGRYLAYKRYTEKGAKGGADLVVRNLETGEDMSFGNVRAHAWCEEAPLLALVLDTGDDVGNGVALFDASNGTLSTLDSKKADYSSLSWRDDAPDLAFLRETDNDKKKDEEASQVVVVWTGLGGKDPVKTVWDHREDKSFPEKKRVVTTGGIRWHEQGEAVFFSIRDWEKRPEKKDKKDNDEKKTPDAKPAADKKAADGRKSDKKNGKSKKKKKPEALRDSLDEHAGVDVWHAKDTKIIPRQKKTASSDRNKSHLCALWLNGKKFVRLADDTVDSVRVFESGTHGLGRDTEKYEKDAMFGPTLVDAYVVDTRTGARKLILPRQKFLYASSPDGRHLLYVKDSTWCLYDIESGDHRKLDVAGKIINDERGVLTDENRPYGTAGWSKDSRFVYLYTKFDILKVDAKGGTTRRLTNGSQDGTRYRVLRLDRDEDHILADKPIYVSTYGEYNKMSGFSRINADGSVDRLLWKPSRTSSLTRADEAEVFTWSEQSFDDSPDIFTAGSGLSGAKQLTATNPQQKDYFWGRGELVDYENERGVKLQGALHYPADYKPGTKYPMIVYIYEKRSQNLHAYSTPSERSPYNPAVFTTQGYFVYQPDIVYRPQNPGLSALECVVPAVKKVLERGDIDAARVGLVGHSWGAYQTAFIVSRSDVFAAGIAGAPLTNMMSMSTNIYWNTGNTNAQIFHESQGRMDQPFWRDVDTYIKNSPIFGMDSLNTPLLIAFGDKDGAVDWHQGIEMYNAARLAEKQMVMLVYEGENHGLRKKPNQVDYHWRIREWFGHYLKGDPAPAWITQGTSFLEREKQKEKLDEQRKKKGGKKK